MELASYVAPTIETLELAETIQANVATGGDGVGMAS